MKQVPTPYLDYDPLIWQLSLVEQLHVMKYTNFNFALLSTATSQSTCVKSNNTLKYFNPVSNTLERCTGAGLNLETVSARGHTK